MILWVLIFVITTLVKHYQGLTKFNKLFQLRPPQMTEMFLQKHLHGWSSELTRSNPSSLIRSPNTTPPVSLLRSRRMSFSRFQPVHQAGDVRIVRHHALGLP